MKSPIFDLRLHQLENNITRAFTRIDEYQVELEDERDPNQRSQYRRRIEQLRGTLVEYQKEYSELQKQELGDSSTQMQTVSSQLQRLNIQINSLGNLVLGSHKDLKQVLLARYTASEQMIVSEITKQLNQNQLITVEAALQAVDSNQVPVMEMQELVIEAQNALTLLNEKQGGLSAEKQRVSEMLKSPELDFQHKVKVSLPIIPLLVDYEAEIGLGTGFNLKSMWERWKENFRGN
ncbi:MAG: hypothetical protein WBG32_00030 [Nodosilinea sp.]